MLRYIFCALLLSIFALGCAREVPSPEAQPAPAPTVAAPSATASLPATQMEASTSGKSALGRLGLTSEAPAGMCWLNMADNSPDAALRDALAPNAAETSLQALAIAVNCQQLQAWKTNKSLLPVNYIIIAQKMDERVGGGGANQAKERWVMVQGLGGNYGFFPQDQYTKLAYLSGEAAKLAPNGHKQMGEVRRDDMALYTVELKRRGENAPQFILTQYSQLRGTPVALLWNKPLQQVEALSKEVMNGSAYLAGLVRQSDDPRLAASAPPPQQPETSSQAQTSAEALIGGSAVASDNITGWQQAKFGMTPAELREHYTLANPLREDLHGKAFYLDGRNEKIGNLEFRVLFDFSDSPMGSQRLGRIIFSNTTTGGNTSQHKAAILADLNQRYGAPTNDASANGGPISWERDNGKASLQMMSSSGSTVWLMVLEAKK